MVDHKIDIFEFYGLKSTFTFREAAMALAEAFEWNLVCQGMYDTVVRAAEFQEFQYSLPGFRLLVMEDDRQCLDEEQQDKCLVSRADLKAWCESKGIYPKALFLQAQKKELKMN